MLIKRNKNVQQYTAHAVSSGISAVAGSSDSVLSPPPLWLAFSKSAHLLSVAVSSNSVHIFSGPYLSVIACNICSFISKLA